MEKCSKVQPTLEDLLPVLFQRAVKNVKKTDSFELRKVFSKRLALIALVELSCSLPCYPFTFQNKYAFDKISVKVLAKQQ